MALQPSPAAQLSQLLVELFIDAAEMKRFVRSITGMTQAADALPSDTVSSEVMADAVVSVLGTRGLVTEDFFQSLVRARFQRCGDIEQAQAIWRKQPYGFAHSKSSRKGLRLVLVGAILAGLMISDRTYKIKIYGGMPDQIHLKVVSRRTGESWSVSISKHRSADSAAKDIFGALHLNGSKATQIYLGSDTFELCQLERCYRRETVGRVIVDSEPVWIKRSNKIGALMAPCKPPVDLNTDAVLDSCNKDEKVERDYWF